jgi:CRP/FNR family transcriptional regulator, cyclic AMP receptor protein
MSLPQNKTYRPGQMLFSEGETPRSMFLIKKGSVAIRKLKGSGFVDIARVHSNEVVGELSFFDRQPRSAAGFALTEVEATEIPFAALEKIFESLPAYFRAIIGAMAERQRKSNDVIKRLQKTTVGQSDGVELQKEEDLDAAGALAAAAAALDDPGSGGDGTGGHGTGA